MPIYKEQQFQASCDSCGMVHIDIAMTKREFVQYIRQVIGWSVGEKVLCPKCKRVSRLTGEG